MAKEPIYLYAELNCVPDDYHFTDEELHRIIAGDMLTPRQGAIMARELMECHKVNAAKDEDIADLKSRLSEWEDCKHDGATWYDFSGHERCGRCEADV